MVRLFARAIMSLFLFIMISACSDRPSGSVITSAIEDYADSESIDGVFVVKNAKKNNGYMLDEFYNLEISYDRYCLVGIDEAISIMNQELASAKPTNLAEGLTLGVFGMASGTGMLKLALANEYGYFSKGETLHETATIRFIKTDNGWQVYSG